MTKPVVKQQWDESERGWGRRPDGYSLHLTIADAKAYIAEYWARMPKEVPDCYSMPDGDPFVVDVSDDEYKLIKKSKNGIRRG